MSRTTVRKYFYAEACPERAKRLPTPSILDAYVQVSRWMRQRRQAVAPTTPGPYRETVAVAIRERAEQTKPTELPSDKQLAWLLI